MKKLYVLTSIGFRAGDLAVMLNVNGQSVSLLWCMSVFVLLHMLGAT